MTDWSPLWQKKFSEPGGHCPPFPVINWCVERTLRKTFYQVRSAHPTENTLNFEL
jgi:hypothetical protein